MAARYSGRCRRERREAVCLVHAKLGNRIVWARPSTIGDVDHDHPLAVMLPQIDLGFPDKRSLERRSK